MASRPWYHMTYAASSLLPGSEYRCTRAEPILKESNAPGSALGRNTTLLPPP
jgi:hypothetical protein